jgi:hypothetical protein
MVRRRILILRPQEDTYMTSACCKRLRILRPVKILLHKRARPRVPPCDVLKKCLFYFFKSNHFILLRPAKSLLQTYVCMYIRLYLCVCVCVCVCVFICRCHRLQQRPLSRSATQSSRGEGRAGSQPWIVSGSCRSSVCPRTRGQKMPRGGSRGYPQQTTLN